MKWLTREALPTQSSADLRQMDLIQQSAAAMSPKTKPKEWVTIYICFALQVPLL